MARHSLPLSIRDQFDKYEIERCSSQYSHKLGFQLYGQVATRRVLFVIADTLLVVQITPLGVTNLQWKFYIIWTISNAAMIPVIYLFFPETADRSLEDVERFFRENHDIFVFRHKDATSVKRPHHYVVDEENRVEESKAKQEEGQYPDVKQVEKT